MTTIEQLSMAFSVLAKECGYLYDFDPEKYLRGGDEYYSSRAELVKLEKKCYINIVETPPYLVIQMKRFIVWDDTIDEEDSSWVEEKVLFEMCIDPAKTTTNSVIDEFLDTCPDDI